MRRFLVKSFYLLVNWGAQTKIPEDAGDFRLLSPRAAECAARASGAQPFLQGAVELDRLSPDPHRLSAGARADGRSTWNLRSLIGLSIDGLTGVFGGAVARRHMLGPLLALDRFHLRRANHL